MLHEILLSLSGLPSPIWEDLKDDKDDSSAKSLGTYTSPAEKPMLKVLAELVKLHIKLREATAQLSRSHPSPTSRAVSNRIKSKHLRDFTNKIIQVETSVLQEDAKYLGAYKIVPLSTIVTEFQPWLRPFRWLWQTVQVLQSEGRNRQNMCTAAQILDFLQKEGHTGYTDIKGVSTDLLVAAQQAWLQGLTPWVLYGQLPHFGTQDYMIEQVPAEVYHDYRLRSQLVPGFVSDDTAESILAIGKALNQIKSRGGPSHGPGSSMNVCATLLPSSLASIKSLNYPLQDNAFANAIKAINDTISYAALSYILPTDAILELLVVIQDYVLLKNGEFSSSLIRQAEKRLQHHQSKSSSAKPVRKLGRLDDMVINEADAATILTKTWSEVAALIPVHDTDDSCREKATAWIRLKTVSARLPVSTLLPVNAGLVIDLPLDSPLHIFLSQEDTISYCKLSAYLISLHRAEAQIIKLWHMPAHRRCHPTPLDPPRGSTRNGQQLLAKRRAREDRRGRSMRTHWACASQALFLLSELANYFHGEVMRNSWDNLRAWLGVDINSRPGSSRLSSRPTTASSKRPLTGLSELSSDPFRRSTASAVKKADPRAIAKAHHKYVETLYHSMLLDNTDYVSVLRELLVIIDHFVALFHRLQIIWQGIDLQEDEGIMDAFSNHKQEEADLMAEMARTNDNLKDRTHGLVGAIHDAEKLRDLEGVTSGVANIGSSDQTFEPWRARTLDRLLMKLDSLAVEREDRFEDALVGGEDD